MKKILICLFVFIILSVGILPVFGQASSLVGLSEELRCDTLVPEFAAETPCAVTADINDAIAFRIQYRIHNYSSTQTATNLQITKDLAAMLSSQSLTLSSVQTVYAVNGFLTVNGAFDGAGNQNIIAGGSLAPGKEEIINVIVRVKVPSTPTFGNYYSVTDQSTLSGLLGATPFTDLSQNGVIPDANGDGDPGNDGVPTSQINLGVGAGIEGLKYSSEASETQNPDGSWTVSFLYRVGNNGNAYAYNAQLVEDLKAFLPAPATYTINSVSAPSHPFCQANLNPAFNGDTDKNLLVSNLTFPPHTGCDIGISLNVQANGIGPWVYNTIANSWTLHYTDTNINGSSQSGATTNYSNYPPPPGGDTAHYTPFLLANPVPVGYALQVKDVTSLGGNNYQVTWRLTAKNYGSTPSTDVFAVLPIDQTGVRPADQISFVSGTVVSGPVTLNPSYNGSPSTAGNFQTYAFFPTPTYDPEMTVFNGATFNPGDEAVIDLVFNYTDADCLNQNTLAGGYSVNIGVPTNEFSVDGTDPDPDNNNDPTNNASQTYLSLPCSNPGAIPIDKMLLQKSIGTTTYPPIHVRQGDEFNLYLSALIPTGYKNLNQNLTITDTIPSEFEVLQVTGRGNGFDPEITTFSGQDVTCQKTLTGADFSYGAGTYGGLYFIRGGGFSTGCIVKVRVRATNSIPVGGILTLNTATLTTNGQSINSRDGDNWSEGTIPGCCEISDDSGIYKPDSVNPIRPTQIFIDETLRVTKTLSGIPYPGAVLTNNITTSNVYSQSTINSIIDDTLNSTMSFVPGSIVLNGVPQTDAEDGDLCYYRPVEGRVHCNIGSGANPSTGGVLIPGQSVTLSFKTTSNAATLGDVVSNTAIAQAIGAYAEGTDSLTYTGAPPLIGPKNAPDAVGPVDNNDDYTQRTLLGNLSATPGDTLTAPESYTFINTVKNPTTANSTFSVAPTTVPAGWTVECSLDNVTFVPCSAGSAFDLGNFAPGDTKDVYVKVTVPAGALVLNSGNVVLDAFVTGTPDLKNQTINQLYTGAVELVKTQTVVNNTGVGTSTSVVKGAEINYSIAYRNVVADLGGGTGNSPMTVNNLVITEDGNLAPNNWGSTTSQKVGSAADSNGGTITGDAAGSSLLTDTLPSLAAGVSGTFSFTRIVN